MDEVLGCLSFLDYVYSVFGFSYDLYLSTRPADRLGEESLWDQAESALENALNQFGKPWKFNLGDGAFYGPKIDIKVFDAMKRPHQCGTVQLDFQLPIRFNLQYKTDHNEAEDASSQKSAGGDQNSALSGHEGGAEVLEEQKHQLKSEVFLKDELDEEEFKWEEHPVKHGNRRPVIIHRAILGSIERFSAILMEHLAGKWPFWISPRQAIIAPVSDKFLDYCEKVQLYLQQKGFEVEVDRTNVTLNKKIRNN